MEVKTLEGWSKMRGSISDYLKIGDAVDEEIYDYFLNVLPPETHRTNLLQVGEPSSHVDGKPTYFTLEKYDGYWYYKGDCFRGENEAAEPLTRGRWKS